MNMLLQIGNDLAPGPEGIEAMLKFAQKMGIRLTIDLATMLILVRGIYFRIYKQQEFFFMFVIFNIIIFMISFILNKVELSMGAAFGLFAVFSMLRYRTESISIKEMTYLFLCIAIGLLTAITKIKSADDRFEYLFLIGLNAVILLFTWLLETNVFVKKESSKMITYSGLDLIAPDQRDALIEDLKIKTGLLIHRVIIQEINFVKGSVDIKVYYYE